ncbi:putative protein kinase [Trypanosoma vivax]|nr:putative protein kinase [Trypanosoma vivax]
MSTLEVIRTIGEGSFGVVIKCRCRKTGVFLAVKLFKANGDPCYARRVMLREIRAMHILRGKPGIVPLVNCFYFREQPAIAMEYIGCNLLNIIEKHPEGIPLAQLRKLLFTLLIGVQSCHHNGILHRDVKPENTLVREGTALLCDFGTSRVIPKPQVVPVSSSGGGVLQKSTNQSAPLTNYVATRWYRSPEMLLGVPDYGFASDMWAVGAVMAELALGDPLFPGTSEMEQLSLIRERVGDFKDAAPLPRRIPSDGSALSSESSCPAKGTQEDSGDYLSRTYRSVLGPEGLDLLRSLLFIDCQKRLTVDEALSHAFFSPLVTCGAVPRKLSANKNTLPPLTGFNLSSNHDEIKRQNTDSTDGWFGLGCGRPVEMEEVELLYSPQAVNPKTIEVLKKKSTGTKRELGSISLDRDPAAHHLRKRASNSRANGSSFSKTRQQCRGPLVSVPRPFPIASPRKNGKRSSGASAQMRESVYLPTIKVPRSKHRGRSMHKKLQRDA